MSWPIFNQPYVIDFHPTDLKVWFGFEVLKQCLNNLLKSYASILFIDISYSQPIKLETFLKLLELF